MIAHTGHHGRIIHDPIDGIPDTMIVQGGHRQPCHAPKQSGAQMVGDPLGESCLDQGVAHADYPAGLAAPGVQRVFRLGGTVFALGKSDPHALISEQEEQHHVKR